jgi:uncharacterized caspase-like protein
MFSDTYLQKHIYLTPRLVATLIFFLAGCSLPAAKAPSIRIPASESAQCIKHYERLEVYAHRLPWTKTSIVVEEGDKLLIFASGTVSIHREKKRFQNLQPNDHLHMMIGEEGTPQSAVSFDNQRYFKPLESGRLFFAVKDWRSIEKINWDWFNDNSGSYLVDVFVITEKEEIKLGRALRELALNHPEDELLNSQIDKFMEINGDIFYSDVEIVSTPPNASVYLNGFLQGKTPNKLEDLDKSRTEEICVRFKGYHDYCQMFSSKDTSKLYVELRPKSSLTTKMPINEQPQVRVARKDDSNVSKISVPDDIDFGGYHALVIGNNDYNDLPRLKTAINDARDVAENLRELYGFEVRIIVNGTRRDIISELDRLRIQLTEKENLLVYYAGHGYFDKLANRGYWLPVDASYETSAEWISNADITDKLKALRAKHVMVVADSCYSGTLTRGIKIKHRSPDYYLRMSHKRARTVLTSGGFEPVIDSGGGEHSVFAQAFLDALRANEGIMDGTQLFSQLRRPVMLNAPQTPQYSDIRFAGHEGGDFLFVRTGGFP